jgi:hypothetical protein
MTSCSRSPGRLVRRFGGAAVVTALLVPAVPAGPADATSTIRAAARSAHFIRPALIPFVRHDVPIPRRPRTGSSNLTTSERTQPALVAAPPAGAVKSTWQVTYTGFDAASNPQGPQARAAFQAAVNIWSQIVSSPLPIKVDASFTPLPYPVLGSAGSSADYSGVGDGRSFYSSALADAISGTDQSTLYSGAPASDITAQFSSAPSASFYFGTDGAPPAGTVDFESVVLHELGHGVGFAGSMQVGGGAGSYWTPYPERFDRFTYDAPTAGTTLLSRPSGSTALAGVLQSQSVYWGGTNGVADNGGARPRMFAPSTWQPGSSYSHLDEATYGVGNANSLMTPSISASEVIHSPGPIAVGILGDEGWQAALPPPTAPAAPAGVTAVAGDSDAGVFWNRPYDGGSAITGYAVTSSPGGSTCTTSGTTSCTVSGLTNGTSYTFRVTATNAVGTSAASSPSSAVTPASPVTSTFVPVTPTRMLDTRSGLGAPKAKVDAGQSIALQITGRSTPQGTVPANATAVVMTVTAVNNSTVTNVRVYPSGAATVPTISNLNTTGANQTVPDLVTTALGSGGKASLFNAAGTTDLLADIAGYYVQSGGVRYQPLVPTRVLDTRYAIGVPSAGAVGAGQFRDLHVAGSGTSVPASATAVVLNVTGTQPTTTTNVRLYPTASGTAVPTVSNLNLTSGKTAANLVTVAVGNAGSIRLYNTAGTVQLIADLAGYYDTTAPGVFVAITPTRFLDTRNGNGAPAAPVGQGMSVDLQVTGSRGIPSNALATVLTLTGTNSTTSTVVRAYPSTADTVPTISNLNLTDNDTRANAGIIKIGTSGSIRLYNGAGTVNLLADLAGYFITG